jgi:putative copper resistance protein D
MPVAYWISVTVHVLAAMLWLGGMLFLGVVGAPVLRTLEPELRQSIFHALGVRFRTVGWMAIAVLVGTGLLNLHYRGLLQWDGVLASHAFWNSSLGRALAVKAGVVIVMLVLAAVHDFVLGPAAGRVETGSADFLRLRRLTMLVGRVNAVLAIVLVVAAVRLARGG